MVSITQTREGARGGDDRIRMVTHGTFDELVLQAGRPTVVEFMSYGCSHCRALEPVLQEVATMVSADVTFVRVNVAVEQRLADSYGVRGTPTLVMFSGGQEVGRVEGPLPTTASVLAAVTQPFEDPGAPRSG